MSEYICAGMVAYIEIPIIIRPGMYEEAEKIKRRCDASSDLLTALTELVWLHLCEQEGLAPGAPTPEQWIAAVDKATLAIKKAEGKIDDK